jgi:hypothetical protein
MGVFRHQTGQHAPEREKERERERERERQKPVISGGGNGKNGT